MKYISTRAVRGAVNSATAIIRGISRDGGLFIPESFPRVDSNELIQLKKMSYKELAKNIFNRFLTDYSESDINIIVENSYDSTFDTEEIVPVKELDSRLYVAELWHGPTSAFKDVALQVLPSLMKTAKHILNINEKIMVLTATSGDTGKAALEGFKNIDGIEVTVFYPKEGISEIQHLQMATQAGDNVHVIAVDGNFDDAQNGVKNIFADAQFNTKLSNKGYMLSSANSINWGRLLPQIIYYFSSYLKIMTDSEINVSEPLDCVVPTGNFGNILAGYYAKKMGLPIGRLICASNANNVLYDFIKSGTYNASRELIKTVSPSMDILVSSNLERLIFDLSRNDEHLNMRLQKSLKENKNYNVDEKIMRKILVNFDSAWANEDETKDTIKSIWDKFGYLIDTHTAVGFAALNKIRIRKSKTVVMATASPYKFASDVLTALGEDSGDDMFSDIDRLNIITNTAIPKNIIQLKESRIIHREECVKEKMKEILDEIIK